MYQGYLALAGAEIANVARTESYMRHLLPGFSVPRAIETDGLDLMLGDTGGYRSPALDPAPWYSEHRPASARFLGFYPTSISGIEDTERSMQRTELIDDGAVFGKPRRMSKEFRVKGVLVAEDGEGLDAGFRWLKGALAGSGCGGDEGNCVGDSLCYLGFLPQFCDYGDGTKYPRRPVDWRWKAGQKGDWVGYRNGSIVTLTNGVRVDMPCQDDGAQWVVNGLIPGQWYRLWVDMTPTAGEMEVSVSGHTEMVSRREQNHVNIDRTPYVIDFQARNESEAVRVTNATGECEAGTARIYGMRVARTPARRSVFLPRFTAGNYSEPASWTWVDTGDVAKHAQQLPDPDESERLTLSWTNNGGSSLSIGADSGAQRLIRGLIPGRYYSVVAKLSTDDPNIEPGMDILGATNENFTSLGYGWFSRSFRATATQHYVRVTTEAFVLSGTSTSRIFVDYMRVDQSERTMPLLPPDQLLEARRTLHGVALIGGPTVLAEYPDDRGGRLREVEFSMSAARPHIYSETFDLNTSLDYTTFLVPTGQCSQGLPVRENLYTNPDSVDDGSGIVKGGVGSYEALGGVGALTYEVGPITGRPAIKVPFGASATYIDIPVTGLLEGHTYTVSATFEQETPMGAVNHSDPRSIKISNDAGIIESDSAINGPGRQRVSVTFIRTGVTDFIHLINGSTDQDVWWSDILIEESGVAGRPFSGSLMGDVDSYLDLSWAGTPHQSVSIYKRTAPSLIRDPDCPPMPTAPQPPSITPECISSVTEWRRYWMEVPARYAGGWNESVPVVKLTTGDNIVRDVRIRFYANPTGERVSEIAPCDYCGEFFISYIPKNATFTIDAINRTAMADVRGSGQQRVMHLVSDADYGPIDWPVMTCDTDYFMTVDIAPDEVLDVDVALAVALKE